MADTSMASQPAAQLDSAPARPKQTITASGMAVGGTASIGGAVAMAPVLKYGIEVAQALQTHQPIPMPDETELLSLSTVALVGLGIIGAAAHAFCKWCGNLISPRKG